MAATMRHLVRFNVGLASNNLLRNSLLTSYRFLYSEKTLGLQGYENARLNFRNQFLNVEHTFRNKMQEVCNTESSMIFTEDLKSMLHLAQKKPEDIELLIKMITKFNNQNNEMRFGTFIFGPVVMRTLYYLDEPDLALTAFKDPQLKDFFNQLISYQILLSLLYKHKRYTEIRDVYDIIKTKEIVGGGYARNSFVIVMAACYKENSEESFKYALNCWKEMNEKGHIFLRRAITFLTALAIKQGAPHVAIEILTSIREGRYIDIRCLKVIAYTDLRKFAEIVPILRLSLEQDRPNARKETYFKDVIDYLEENMAKENLPVDFELHKLISLLKTNDFILPDTLEDHICMEINSVRPTNFESPRRQQFSQQNQFPRNTRSVLRDLL